jgi:uncharacterized membrane protein
MIKGKGKMTNLLIMLGLLIGGYLLLTVVDQLWSGITIKPHLRGRISLALVFLFTAIGHFFQPQQLVEMLPPWVPGRLPIIYLTGLLEIAGAIGLLIPQLSRLAGICLIAFLILVLPANIYAAFNQVGMGGHTQGPAYLWVRVPVQLILIGWTYWFAVHHTNDFGLRRYYFRLGNGAGS